MISGGRLPALTRHLMAGASVVIILAGVRAANEIVAPVLLSLVLAIAIAPMLDWLRLKGVPSWLAWVGIALSVVVSGLAVIGAIFWLASELVIRLPTYEVALTERVTALSTWVAGMGVDLPELRPLVQANATALLREGAELLARLISSLYAVGLVLFLAVLFLLGASGLSSQLWEQPRKATVAATQFVAFSRGVQQNMLGLTLNNAATAFAMAIWLMVFRVDFAVLWAFLAFFLGYVPNVGMFLAAVPPTLLALVLYGLETALIVAFGLVVIAAIFNVVTNAVLGQAADLSPAASFVAFIFWSWVLGPLGALLSYPLTIALKLALQSNQTTFWLAAAMGSKRLEVTQSSEPTERSNVP